MQIGRKMTELEAFKVLSVILEHPVLKGHFFGTPVKMLLDEKI